MMLAITFHHHSEAEGVAASPYCYDCAHHIHHDGHLTATGIFYHDCALCQLYNMPYVVPTIVRIATFVVSLMLSSMRFVRLSKPRKAAFIPLVLRPS